jgi:hypothetical protein
MKVRIVILGFLALAALAGCSPDADSRKSKVTFDTPHAVCDAWLTAMDNGDFSTAVSCLAPESVKTYAMIYAWEALDLRDDLKTAWAKSGPRFASREHEERERQRRRERKERGERLDPLLRAHGLTKQVSDELRRFPTATDASEALRGKIRDHAGFLVQYLEATHDRQPLWRKGNWPRPRVDELAINGDKAEGKLIYRTNRVDKGKEVRELKKDVSLVRLRDGGWRVTELYLNVFFDEE